MLAKVVFVALLAVSAAFAADVAGEAETAVAAESEQQTEQQVEVNTEAAAETETETEVSAETETEAVAETETEAAAETETETEAVAEGEAEAEAEAEVDEEGKPKKTVKTDGKTIIKPHMHARGALRRGHVKPYPVGYNSAKYRAPKYYRGGRAKTTEELLHNYPQVDTRKEIQIPGEGQYNWETPEYAHEYNARTGMSARRPVPRQGRKSIPVVHYQRGTHHMRPRNGRRGSLRHHSSTKPRRANTPKAAKPDRVPRRPRRSGRRAHPRRRSSKKLDGAHMGHAGVIAKKNGGKKSRKHRLSQEDRLSRLEKTMTFALRELGRHLGRMRKVERFAQKGKKAITLIAKTLKDNQQRVTLATQQVDALRQSQVRTNANLQNLHLRSKGLNGLMKKHKKVIKLIATEYAKSIRTNKKSRGQVKSNVASLAKYKKVLKMIAQEYAKSIRTNKKARAHVKANAAQVDALRKNVGDILENQRKAILASAQRMQKDERQVIANEINTKALHTFAQNAQAAILDLDKRLKATSALAQKEKQAFRRMVGVLNTQMTSVSQLKNHEKQASRKGTGH